MRYIRLSAVLLLAACGDGGGSTPTAPTTPTPPTPVATSITLSATSLSFSSLGETSQLTATVKDQNGATMSGASVTWATSAASVATVSSSGLVTSVADGTATITATSGSASGTAEITVNQVSVLATLELSGPADSVQVNDSAQFTATVRDENGTVLNGQTITWTVSDETFAEVVASGYVKGLRPGDILLTATSGQAMDTMTVRITENWQIEAGIRISPGVSSSTLQMPDGSFRTWLPGIKTYASADGLTWDDGAFVTGLSGASGDFLSNPSVLRLGDGTYIMIYEGSPRAGSSGSRRLFRATSPDAINWTKVNGAGTAGAVMDPQSGDNGFLSVPDMILLSDGSIRIYFVAGGDHTESAQSTDNGATWTREGRITISGLSTSRWDVDPDIIRLSNGSYRLYFAAGLSAGLSNKRIYSARSTDGLTFTLEAGERIGVPSGAADNVDPDVILLSNGTYRMYFGRFLSAGQAYELWSALSL